MPGAICSDPLPNTCLICPGKLRGKIQDEAWGFSKLILYADSRPLDTTHKDHAQTSAGWSSSSLISTGDGAAHGPFAGGTEVGKLFSPLKAHSILRIKARYWAVDSWDNEDAVIKVDAAEWWRQSHQYQSDKCESGSTMYSDTFPNPWSEDNTGAQKHAFLL